MIETSRGTAETEHAQRLRVLIANETPERLARLVRLARELGHEPIAQVDGAASAVGEEHPEVALVGLESGPEHALELISAIVRQGICPVVALLAEPDPDYVAQAAARGVFAHLVGEDAGDLRGAIAIAVRRFGEYELLRGAFGRRALIEQAKGILMARHLVGADQAFEMLREHSQRRGRKIADVAGAIVESHVLLLPKPPRP